MTMYIPIGRMEARRRERCRRARPAIEGLGEDLEDRRKN
jgi:hypothetical protein